MRQHIKNLLFVISLSLVCTAHAFDFPDKALRKEIGIALFNEIDTIDAVIADARNRTRQVKWAEFQQTSIANIENARNWQALYRAIDDVHYGIINRHSYLSVEKAIAQHVEKSDRWPAIEIGYSWPEIEFHELASGKLISRINDKAVKEIYDNFYDWYCNDAHAPGCLSLFSRHMGAGYRFAGSAEQMHIDYEDGTSKTITPSPKKPQPQKPEQSCEDHYLNSAASLRYAGEQACLFETEQAFIIKIFYFGDWGTDYSDIYCTDAQAAGMCRDINSIKQLINQSAIKTLVVDLQDNGGGTENTPWIAAITAHGFYDNFVRFRNISALANADTRRSAFYYSDRAESWYQSIQQDITPDNKFLPTRSDFCRASKICGLNKTPSAKYPIKYSELRLIVNNGCVSSCDDFVWRTRKAAGAKTFGQLPATDGAYSRLDGYLFLTKNNKVLTMSLGEDQSPKDIEGTLLVTWRIPISKTVNTQGNPLEASASVLDHALPITVENFATIQLDNVKRTLAF